MFYLLVLIPLMKGLGIAAADNSWESSHKEWGAFRDIYLIWRIRYHNLYSWFCI